MMEYGLIGNPLGHSYSKEIHARIGDYPYELRELAPDEVAPFFAARKFRAVNVTIPYKHVVLPMLDVVSPEARRIGAVNTVVNRGGKLYGYNTDHAGLCALLRRGKIPVRGGKVLVLGSGGTGRTACAAAETLGAREVLTVSRRPGPGQIGYGEALSRHADAEVLINATPVGMYPNVDASPVDPAAFPALAGAADAVYHPLRTEFVLRARERGVPAVGGLYMLAAQGVIASGLFFGREPEEALADRVYASVRAEKENVALIGMPTAGKTSVGRALAEALGRPLVDTDAEAEKKLGVSVAEYIRTAGEAAFRAVERQCVAEAALASGAIIATGGGAVLDPANVRALRRNSRVVFLDRPPELLAASADRPLSADPEALAARYRERYGLYLAAADLRVKNDRAVADACAAILADLRAAERNEP